VTFAVCCDYVLHKFVSYPNPDITQKRFRFFVLKPIYVVVAVVVVIVVIVVGAVAFMEMNALKGNSNTSSTNSSSGAGSIVSGTFTVGPSSYKAYLITIPSSVTAESVTGSYSVTGGNMTIWIFSAAGYATWEGNHSDVPPYDYYWRLPSTSPSTTVDSTTMSTKLGSGTYYLIFDNVDATVFGKAAVDTAVSKTVTANIGLQNP
jgi:hypothetical protein